MVSKVSLNPVDDKSIRRSVLKRIIIRIKEKRPDWSSGRIIKRAVQLEERIYHSAGNSDEYLDSDSFPGRFEKACLSLMLSKRMRCSKPVDETSHEKCPLPVDNEQKGCFPPKDEECYSFHGLPLFYDDGTSTVESDDAKSTLMDEILSKHEENGPKGQHLCSTENVSECNLFSGSIIQRRLLLLLHASKCIDADCTLSTKCITAKFLLQHVYSCTSDECLIPECDLSRKILDHYSRCRETNCAMYMTTQTMLEAYTFHLRASKHKAKLQELHDLRKRKREAAGSIPPDQSTVHKMKHPGAENMLITDNALSDSPPTLGPGFFIRQARAAAQKLNSMHTMTSEP